MAITASTGDKVSFQLMASNIILISFANVMVCGTVNYEAARRLDPELANKHVNMYPYFKDKVNNVDDPNGYEYLLLLVPNVAVPVPIGIPWIREDTFETTGDKTCTIIISSYLARYESPIKDLLGNLGATYTMNVN